ncbi:T9SS type A sorting domain-containing protein [Larkinella humicola]|uniref:T9SS type A sorting domain-containing protein n=1 Tax=Larkinella humicola TaxID=2607654 RepID=A0A5N1JBQ7_9BACT|nr:T9SS type A sorting domain-containing protein [Larkinella humicola]KAA9346299.1 T9SS type A sorting domain-containing protein [Larkinella humicola]
MKNNYRLTLTRQGLLLFVALWGSISSLLAQSPVPPVYWQTVFDKTNTPDFSRGDLFSSVEIARTPDGGSVIMASPFFFNASTPFVTKLDPSGKVAWTTALPNFFFPTGIQTQPNGNIVVAGNFSSNFAPISIGFIRLNPAGYINYNSALDLPNKFTIQRNLGDMVPAPDGGFLLIGYDTPLNSPTQRLDIVLAKVDQNLTLSWYKTIGGSGVTFLFKAIRASEGGGYLIHATSSDPAITGNPDMTYGLSFDFKIDETGTIVWQSVGRQNGVLRALSSRKGGYFAIGNYGWIASRAVFKLDEQLNIIQGVPLPDSEENNSQHSISVATTPDGGCIAVDKSTDSYPNGPHSNYRITKYSPNLDIEWQEQGGGPGNDEARRVIVNPDGTYLIAGTTASPRTFGGIDDGGKVAVWVRRQAASGNALQLKTPTYNCATGAITFNTTGGDGSPVSFSAPGIARSSATSHTGTVEDGLRFDPKPIPIQATQSGVTVSLAFDLKAYCNGGQPSPGGGSLLLTQPTYDCNTGAITFNTTGGDGSPVSFSAPGIARSSATSHTGTVEDGLRFDPKPIPIQATQSGVTVSLAFDLKAYCNGGQPSPGGSDLSFTQPTYDCNTGAITFNTTGGDGSPISFSAPGIARSSATSQTGTVEAGLRFDPKPIPIQATQSGKTINYLFDLPAYCSPNRNARLGESDNHEKLTVRILENPVRHQLRVQLAGSAQAPIQLRITDLQGHVLQTRTINPDQRKDNQVFGVDPLPAGLFILQATTGEQGQSIKFLKK